jgi:arginyl-tRNA synthetase
MPDPLALLAAPLAEAALALGAEAPDVLLERPADESHGDYATSLALRLAKPLRRPPRELAETLREAAVASPWVASAEVAGPGFLNLRATSAWYAEATAAALVPAFGGNTVASRQKVDVEFVSANPTGPLPVSAGRNAAYGDCLARLLAFAGNDVTREYYFNDSGAQMEHFGRSLRARARGEEVHEGGYQGTYLIGIAERTGLGPEGSADDFMRLGSQEMFAEIRATLARFRVEMDVWTSEAAFHDGGKVNAALQRARDGGHLLEREGATWLATEAFGDDKDRVVLRSDGSPTYFAADMAYLVDKLERGFDKALYVLGADHHGYVARLRAGAAALGFDPDRVEVPIYQMVHLMEGGETKRMSKRRGDVVLLDELIDLVGIDAARWYLVSRSHDQTIELDIELAREQSGKNPVYYVQYAHARIAAIERGAGDRAAAAAPDPALAPEPAEAALVRALAEFPRVAAEAADLRAPHRIAAYATELAAGFHAFYRDCRVLDDDDLARTRSRLALCRAARGVLASSLDLLGVDAPDEM